MNILLWVLQIALAFFFLAGGQFKAFQFDKLVKVPPANALSRGTWGVIGVFEMVCAVLLIVPALINWMPVLTPLAAAALAVENLVLAVWYARHSTALRATNPLVWVVAGGVLAAVVAWRRWGGAGLVHWVN